jgi:hypothetical protein
LIILKYIFSQDEIELVERKERPIFKRVKDRRQPTKSFRFKAAAVGAARKLLNAPPPPAGQSTSTEAT